MQELNLHIKVKKKKKRIKYLNLIKIDAKIQTSLWNQNTCLYTCTHACFSYAIFCS